MAIVLNVVKSILLGLWCQNNGSEATASILLGIPGPTLHRKCWLPVHKGNTNVCDHVNYFDKNNGTPYTVEQHSATPTSMAC